MLLGSAALLLIVHHLLSRSLSLHLLLLRQNISLALLLLHLLPHTFALGLLSLLGLLRVCCGPLCSLLVDLLPPQILHLLSRIAVATRSLSGQVRHLPLTRLLSSQVRLCRRRDPSRSTWLSIPTLISNLEFLAPGSIRQRLNS